jgi:hypothetical protein
VLVSRVLEGATMRAVIVCLLLLAAAWLLTAARNPAPDFTDDQFFRFGMEQAAADKTIADAKNWEIAYRIDTPQTAEIACRYNKQAVYLLRFYKARCYHFEKRMDVSQEQVDAIFSFYKERYGTTPEATKSSRDELYYARWMQRDRDIELTAYERAAGTYSVIYQEADSNIESEALQVQEQELQNQPTEIDPLTGKPRPTEYNPPPQDGESQEQGQDQGKGDDSGKSDDKGKGDDKSKGDDKGKGDEKDKGGEETPPPPPPQHDDPGDW